MMQSESIGAIAKALAAAQSELTNPIKKKTAKLQKKDGSASYTYNYADIAEVLDTVRPVFAKHGIAITQPTILAENVLIVQTRLSHSSGEWMASDYPVCSLSGDHKAMGAAMTYARRYALSSIAGVAADDDTDGEGASAVDAPKRKSSAQAKRDGDWSKLEAELADCGSVVAVDKLQKDYQAHEYARWKYDWQQQADELFEKRREDFGQAPGEALSVRDALTGSIALEVADMVQTRADYIRQAHNMIDSIPTDEGLRVWWKDEAPARKRFRLTPAEESDLKARAAARVARGIDAQRTTFVPNARSRAESETAIAAALQAQREAVALANAGDEAD